MTAEEHAASPRSPLVPIVSLLILLVLFWVLMELFSWGILRTYYAVTAGQRDAELQQIVLDDLGSPLSHPLWAGFPDPPRSADIYDPFLSHRFAAGQPIDEFRGTDRYGFVHNGDAERVIDLSDDVTRIVLLGGSSMAGSGASSNAQTIGGHLERQLNANGDGPYQVINAGIGGFYSPLEAVYFMAELVHYRPDAVVMLDGFNDFWHAYPPARDSADDGGWAFPNRSATQQRHVAMFAGVPTQEEGLVAELSKPSALTRVFRFSGLLAAKALAKLTPAPELTPPPVLPASLDPWPRNAKTLSEQGYGTLSHVPYMLANWRNVAGAATAHGMAAALFLQPFIPVAGRTLTPTEEERLDTFFADRPHIDRADYDRAAEAFYADARARLPALQQDLADPRVHVEDISRLLNGMKDPAFIDNVHYTDAANARLAAHIGMTVRSLLSRPDAGDDATSARESE